MPSTITNIFTVLVGILALVAIGIYFFGIPPEMKRKMEDKALKTMGENKASYMVKGKTSTCCNYMKPFCQPHPQSKSRRFPPPTKKTSNNLKRVSVTLSAAH